MRAKHKRPARGLWHVRATQADWWPDVRAELLSFPAARHDDCADALGLIGQIFDRMFAPSVPAPKPKPKISKYRSGSLFSNFITICSSRRSALQEELAAHLLTNKQECD